MKIWYIALLIVAQLIVSSLVNAAPPGVKAKSQTLILTIENNMGSYQVLEAQVVSGNIPPRKIIGEQERGLLFYLKDQHGYVLGQGSLSVSNSIRGVLEKGSDHQHGEYEQDKSVFVLRYPYEQGMEIISLIEQSSASMARSMGAAPSQQLDFSSKLKK